MVSSSNLVIHGTNTQWFLQGGWGNDYLQAGNGGVYVDGGAGNDTIVGGRGHDVLIGGAGDDKVYLSNPNTLSQSLYTGSDVVNAGSGNDSIYGGRGTHDSDAVVHGGTGNDVFFFGNTAFGDYNLYGESGSDVFNTGVRGGNATFFVDGGDGNDSVTAAGGWQEIHGGCGNDLVNASYGEFLIYGEDGNDVVNLKTQAKGVVYGGNGNDTLSGDVSAQYFQLHGDCGDDVLIGTGSVKGNVNGGVYRGGDGNDTITGANTAENIFGDAGCDILRGNGGNDCLWGGSGSDVFVFGRTAACGQSYSATIRDFQDCIDVVQFKGLTGLKFSDLQISTYHEGSVSGTSVHYTDNLGLRQEINFQGIHPSALSAADFQFVA